MYHWFRMISLMPMRSFFRPPACSEWPAMQGKTGQPERNTRCERRLSQTIAQMTRMRGHERGRTSAISREARKSGCQGRKYIHSPRSAARSGTLRESEEPRDSVVALALISLLASRREACLTCLHRAVWGSYPSIRHSDRTYREVGACGLQKQKRQV